VVIVPDVTRISPRDNVITLSNLVSQPSFAQENLGDHLKTGHL
jgi:hypothetical protein